LSRGGRPFDVGCMSPQRTNVMNKVLNFRNKSYFIAHGTADGMSNKSDIGDSGINVTVKSKLYSDIHSFARMQNSSTDRIKYSAIKTRKVLVFMWIRRAFGERCNRISLNV